MSAITVSLATKYAYNVSKDGDHINMQFRSARVSNPTPYDHFKGYFKNSVIAGIFVPFLTQIAYIFPYQYQDFKHIWSPMKLLLQAYLASYKICGKDPEQFLMMILASLFKLDACDFLNFLHCLNQKCKQQIFQISYQSKS